jgi:hypothetical protein
VSIDRWGFVCSKALETLVGKNLTNVGITPDLSVELPYRSPMDYISTVVKDIASIPKDDELVILTFVANDKMDYIAGILNRAIMLRGVPPVATLIYNALAPDRQTEALTTSPILNPIFLHPPIFETAYRGLATTGGAIATYCPVYEPPIEPGDETGTKLFVSLSNTSMDYYFPIIENMVGHDIPVYVYAPNVAEHVREYLTNHNVNIYSDVNKLSGMVSFGDIFIGDGFDVVDAMARGAHVLIPSYSFNLYDAIDNRREYVIKDVSDIPTLLDAAINTPRNCSVLVDTTQFTDILKRIIQGKPQGE